MPMQIDQAKINQLLNEYATSSGSLKEILDTNGYTTLLENVDIHLPQNTTITDFSG